MKTLTKGLVVTILLSISLFFGITYVNTYLLKGESTTSEETNTNTTINPIDNDQLPSVNDPVVTPFYSVLPRAAKELSSNEKINNIGGYNKDCLKSYFSFGNSIYLIFETESTCCDMRAKACNLAVAKVSSGGTVEKVLTFQNTNPEHYLTSSLYDNGIMIVASQTNETIVYTVTTDLIMSRLVLPYVFNDCILRYCYPYNLLITSLDNNINIFAINSDLTINYTLNSAMSGAVELLDCFALDKNYLFANIANKGTIVKFTSSGITSKEEITQFNIEQIIPTPDGYMVSTIINNKAKLVWFDTLFVKYAETNLDDSENIVISFNGCGYFALTYGANGEGKSYFVCRNGDIVSINDTDFANIKQVTNIEVYQGCLYISAITYGANNTAVIYEYDGNHFYANIKISVVGVSTTRFFGFLNNNILITLYTTALGTGQHISNWGEDDIFIKITALQA